MNIQVLRLNSSSYQDHQFLIQEKEALESLPGVSYTNAVAKLNGEDPIILISNTHTDFTQISPSILERTLLLIHPNSGYDNFEKDFIANAQFPIILGNAIRAHAVLEYVMGCLFQHYSPVPHHTHWAENRSWDRKLIRDQKILILGHGHIGQLLKNTLGTFSPNVNVYDPFEDEDHSQSLYSKLDDRIVKNSTVVIVACNLNKTSEHMVNADFFSKINNEAVIINAARGGIVEENDLTHFLQKNPKAKAYLDVFQTEPFSPGHLVSLENVNKTSHIAGVHKRLNKDIIQFEFHMVKQFLKHYQDNQQEAFVRDYNECLLKADENYIDQTVAK
jgi:D-3-phosphoglycerate dehydrogenase